MNNIFKKVIHIGVDTKSSESIQKEVIKANLTYLIALPINIAFALFYLSKSMLPAASLLIIGTIGLIFAFILNSKGKYKIASVYIAYLAFFLFAIGLAIYGRGYGFEYGFFLMAVSQISRNHTRSSATTFFSILIVVAIASLWYTIDHLPISGTKTEIAYVDFFAFLACLFWVIAISYTNIFVNRRFELQNEQLLAGLKSKNKELTSFAYVASHDMKEPLRQVKSFSQLLSTNIKNENYEKSEEYLSYIGSGIEQMDSMITDLLKYATAGDAINYEYKGLSMIYNTTLSNLGQSIEQTGAVISCSNIPNIKLPKTPFIQVLQNLIGNAIKFRKKNEKCIISIEFQESNSGLNTIVSDNGIGIKKEDQEKVFQIFTRINSKTEYEGSGIGLATCQKIIENLEGTIKLASEINQGTTFTIFIPQKFIKKN